MNAQVCSGYLQSLSPHWFIALLAAGQTKLPILPIAATCTEGFIRLINSDTNHSFGRKSVERQTMVLHC